MRILIYGINYAPELTGIGKFTGEMAQWLSEKHVMVRVVTAPPYYPEWKIGFGYSASKYTVENTDRIKVWRCPIRIPKRKSGIKRIFHLLSFAVSSLPILLKQIFWKPDIIIVIEPTFFCAPLTLMASKLSGATSWLHVQDFEIDAGFAMGFIPPGIVSRIAKFLENIIMKQFDQISTISDKMLEHLVKNHIPYEKCVLFPNWIDTDKISPLSKGLFFRKEWDASDDTVVILYSGNMGEKQGLEIVIEAARILDNEDPNILFIMCGAGAARDRFAEMAKGMKNIRFIPVQPLKRFNELLNSADIHLLPQKDDAKDLFMPSKLTGILACGGIVIASAKKGTELSKVVLQAGGVVCPPGDGSKMAKAIKNIAYNQLLQSEMRVKARNYAESNLSKDMILNKFYHKLRYAVTPRNRLNIP